MPNVCKGKTLQKLAPECQKKKKIAEARYKCAKRSLRKNCHGKPAKQKYAQKLAR